MGVLLQTSEPHEQRQSLGGRVASIVGRFPLFQQKQDGGGGEGGATGILCRQGLRVWRGWFPPGSLSSGPGKRGAGPSFQALGERMRPKEMSQAKARTEWNRLSAGQPPPAFSCPDSLTRPFSAVLQPLSRLCAPSAEDPSFKPEETELPAVKPLAFPPPLRLSELPGKPASPQRGCALRPGFDLIPSWRPQAPALLTIQLSCSQSVSAGTRPPSSCWEGG